MPFLLVKCFKLWFYLEIKFAEFSHFDFEYDTALWYFWNSFLTRYCFTSQSLLNLFYMQSIIWFLARWSRTYLMSSDGIGEKILDSGHHHEHSSKKALLCFFGEHNQGKLVLDIIVRISFIALTSYPGEKDLQVWV